MSSGGGSPNGRPRTAAEMAEAEPWAQPRDRRREREPRRERRRARERTVAERAEEGAWTHEFPAATAVKPRPGPRHEPSSRPVRLPPLERVREPAPPPPEPAPEPVPEFRPPSPERRNGRPHEETVRMRAVDAARRAGAYASTNWRQRNPWAIVLGLVGIGLVLRLLITRGIWVDEAISVHQAQMSLPDMFDDLRETDRHPPLHYLVLWLFVRLFGDGELAVRLPSILASTALIPVLFATGRAMFDRRTGLVAAALATLAPLVIWYGQEARMYSLFMLLGTLAIWAQVRVLRDGRPRNWILYAGITIALLYTHYFALIPIAIQQVVFAIAAWKRTRAGLPVKALMTGCWATWLALVVAAAPLAPFAHEQFQNDQAAGTGLGSTPAAAAPTFAEGGISLYDVLSNFVWAIWGYHPDSTMLLVAALWPLLMLLSLSLLGQQRSASTRVLAALAFGPMLVLLVIGLSKRDLFEVRYFAAVVPVLLLLLARAVAGGARRRTPALLATGALCLTLLVGLADQQLNPHNPRQFDFRASLERIRAEAKPGDTVLYAPDYLADVVDYYAPGVDAEPLDAPTPSVPAEGRVFVVASFLDYPELESEVRQANQAVAKERKLADSQAQERVRVWTYD